MLMRRMSVSRRLVWVRITPLGRAVVPDQFKLLGRCDPCCKLLGEFDVSADVVSQSLHPVVPDHKPELERPEASPQRDLPVAVINDGSRCGRLVAQIFG